MTQAGDADADLADQNLLRERSLDLYRNEPMVKGAFHTHRSNTIGAGLKLQSRIDNDALGISEDQAAEIEAEIERQWRIYSEDPYECDVEQTKTFGVIQDLALISEPLAAVVSSFLSVAIIDDGYSSVDPDADTETEPTAQGIDGDVDSSPGRQCGRCGDRNRGHADDRRACHECGGLGCVRDRLGRGGTQHRPRHSSVARGSLRMDSTQHQVEPKTSPARWASRLAPCPSPKDRRDRKR